MKKIILTILILAFCVSISGAGITDKLRAVIAARNVPAPGGGTPAWGGDIATRLSVTNDTAANTLTVNRNCLTGEHIVVLAYVLNASMSVSSVVDDASNTYALRKSYRTSNNDMLEIWSAPVTAQLDSAEDITITWDDTTYTHKGAAAIYLTDINADTPVDATIDVTDYGTSLEADPPADITITANNSVAIAWIISDPGEYTYGSGSWTNIFGPVSWGAITADNYSMYKEFSSSGTKNPGGAWNTNVSWWGIIVAFK